MYSVTCTSQLFVFTANIEEVLKLDSKIRAIAEELVEQKSLIIMGRGYNFATCLEGALVSTCTRAYVHVYFKPKASTYLYTCNSCICATSVQTVLYVQRLVCKSACVQYRRIMCVLLHVLYMFLMSTISCAQRYLHYTVPVPSTESQGGLLYALGRHHEWRVEAWPAGPH